MESGAIISQRRTAQIGLLAAAAVLVVCIGMLVTNASDTSPTLSVQTVGTDQHQTQSQSPMTLSATDSNTTVAVRR
jgi:hypothetical protein